MARVTFVVGTGTLKSSTFRTNEARGADGGWGEGVVQPRSAQCVLKLRRPCGDRILPSMSVAGVWTPNEVSAEVGP
jgi:hypothetical protein